MVIPGLTNRPRNREQKVEKNPEEKAEKELASGNAKGKESVFSLVWERSDSESSQRPALKYIEVYPEQAGGEIFENFGEHAFWQNVPNEEPENVPSSEGTGEYGEVQFPDETFYVVTPDRVNVMETQIWNEFGSMHARLQGVEDHVWSDAYVEHARDCVKDAVQQVKSDLEIEIRKANERIGNAYDMGLREVQEQISQYFIDKTHHFEVEMQRNMEIRG